MRRIPTLGASLLFASSLLAASPLGSTAVGATPATPPVTQHLTGLAYGTTGTLLSEEGVQTGAGTYATTGQLGRGTYSFRETFTGPGCVPGVGSITANGTARLVRSDGAVLTGTTKVTEQCVRSVEVPAVFVVKLVHGSRDLVSANLEFRGTMSFLATPSGTIGPETFAISGTSSAFHRIGYWMVDSSGTVYPFGGVDGLGNAPTRSAVHIEPRPGGNGYWIVDSSGHVFAFGNAHWLGNANPAALAPGESVTSLSATPTGAGYWLFTDRGLVLPFGDARFYGDLSGKHLNGAVIGSAVTPTGHGYYLVARDGGVFTFGDARFRGSMGSAHLNQPVIGLVPTATNDGYWLVASDGGVFSFDAPFLGSMGSVPLTRPVVGMVRYGSGYMMVAQDGGIFNFSSSLFFGSLGGIPLADPITSAGAVG